LNNKKVNCIIVNTFKKAPHIYVAIEPKTVTLGSRQNVVKPALAYAAALYMYICIDGFFEFGFCSIVVEKKQTV